MAHNDPDGNLLKDLRRPLVEPVHASLVDRSDPRCGVTIAQQQVASRQWLTQPACQWVECGGGDRDGAPSGIGIETEHGFQLAEKFVGVTK